MVVWVIHDQGAARPPPGDGAGIPGLGDGAVRLRPGVEFCECLGEVLRVDERVGRVLVAHFPAHGRRRRRADEEELIALGQREVLVRGVHGRVDAEVDADAVAHERLAVERLPDGDGVLLGEEGDDQALEGFQRRPGVDFGVGVDGLAQLGEGGGVEDLGGEQVLGRVRWRLEERWGGTYCDDECVGGWRGLHEWRQV